MAKLDDFEKYKPKMEPISVGNVIVSVSGALTAGGLLVLAMATKEKSLGTHTFSEQVTAEIRRLLAC